MDDTSALLAHLEPLGVFATPDGAREAFVALMARRQRGWSRVDVAPDRFELYGSVEEDGRLFFTHQTVTLMPGPDGVFAMHFDHATRRQIRPPEPEPVGSAEDVQALALLGRPVSAEEIVRFTQQLDALAGTLLSNEEAALLGGLFPEADGVPWADALEILIRTAPAWPAIVLADLPARPTAQFQRLRDEAVHALGLDGTWDRRLHLPADFPAALLPESRPRLSVQEARQLGWHYVGTHHLVLHNVGPSGWYELWSRVDDPEDEVAVLQEASASSHAL